MSQIRTVYRMVEFSLLARNNSDQIREVYLYVFDALPTLVGSMAYTFWLPYELPYRQAFKKPGRCGTTAACDGEARGPQAEELEVEEASSIDKVPID
jgi:RTA1 like protein